MDHYFYSGFDWIGKFEDTLIETDMGTRLTEKVCMTETLTQHKTVIIGLGKTGLSCARFLSSQGMPFVIMDNRDRPPELDNLKNLLPDAHVFLGELVRDVLCHADELILSPGLPSSHPAIREAVNNGAVVIGDIEIFARYVNAPVIAVTGSNGKSTVASLISEMVKRSGLRTLLGGNIGTPALDLLTQENPDFYVLELSSFQLELVSSLNAIAAVTLNVSADHMDRYADLESYAAAKQRIYRGNGYMIINSDDSYSSTMVEEDRNIIRYSLYPPLADNEFGMVDREGQSWLVFGDEYLLPVSDLLLKGRHNISNSLAALALGKAVGLPMQAMLETLKTFAGLPHRCQRIDCIRGVEWFNDSKGTNVGATYAAIEGLGGEKDLILIAGGEGKGADFSVLKETVSEHVHTIILIGRDANRIASALNGYAEILHATSLGSAVQTAAEIARPGEKVLLSPACASFDMFRDYQERGEVFVQAVNKLHSRGMGE